LTAAQRSRLTPWVHTSRWVPCSISRATTGAPQNMPANSGRNQNSPPTRPRLPKRSVNRPLRCTHASTWALTGSPAAGSISSTRFALRRQSSSLASS
jgi:hypothetical protein